VAETENITLFFANAKNMSPEIGASSSKSLCYYCLISFVLLIVCCLPCLLGE